MRTDRSRGAPSYSPREMMRPREDDHTVAARRQALAGRKDKFEELNQLARACGDAWLVSIPGDHEIMVECLPGSTMPDRLRRLDYQLRDEGTGQRILAHAIVETVLAEDGKKPVRRVTHAGITATRRWSFML